MHINSKTGLLISKASQTERIVGPLICLARQASPKIVLFGSCKRVCVASLLTRLVYGTGMLRVKRKNASETRTRCVKRVSTLEITSFMPSKENFLTLRKSMQKYSKMSLNEKKHQQQTPKSTEIHRPIWHQTHSRHRKACAPTLLFSFASLELRLREPVKPAVPTESRYPQGHRMHKNEHSTGAA